MNFRSIFVLITTCQLFCVTAFADVNSADNPLLANPWKIMFKANGCVDTVSYTSDGRFNIISAEEITDGTYSISKKLPSNFYKVTRKTTKDSGGVDCLGDSKDDTGKESTFFIRFTRSGDYLACTSELLATCGAHYRVPDASYNDHKKSLPECTKDQFLELGSKFGKSIQEKIVYPPEARRNGWEGRAVMNGLMDLETGFLLAEVITSTGFPILDQSLMEATNLVPIQRLNCESKYSDVLVAIPIRFSISEVKIDVKPYKF